MQNSILYIPSFANGGAERVASVLINYWASQNNHITVINTLPISHDFFPVDEQVTRIFLEYNYSAKGVYSLFEKISRLRKLRRTLIDREETIVISFMTSPSILILIASLGLNKKIICCEHTNYYLYGNKITRQLRNILYFLLAEKVTLLTTRDIKNYPVYLRSKLRVLPNPLGVNGFSKQDIITKKTPHSPLQLLFVGRLVPVKGIDRLLDILKSLKHTEGWQLTICGDGELRGTIEDFISQYDLSNKVFLKGSVKNISDYYRNADLLIMTSLSEGLPMVIAEAMSFGVPVIAFDCPTGPREFIKNNSNGVLVEDGNINEYVQKLKFFIENPIKISKLAANAKHSVTKYEVSNIDKIWSDLLDSLR